MAPCFSLPWMLLILYCTLAQCVQEKVNTEQGIVIGETATDGNYLTFYGLRYAGIIQPENRFKGPTPPPMYPGPFNAIQYGVKCAQPSPNGITGVEDCLMLNIFTNDTTTKKPVMVWLASDDYATSVPINSFKSFVERGIVVVEVNHRLSIFGFLCLGVPEAPGNAGLKDVVQALRWIKANIDGFGGDSNNVILFGHGSGAAMVDLINMSPLAENLVHKAITQSGSALSPWAVAYDPIGSARFVGEKLDYKNMANKELAKHLASTKLELFHGALSEYVFPNSSVLFAPCIENESLNPNGTFLTDAPINLLRAGNYSHIPYMSGYTNWEGTIRAEEAVYNHWIEKMQENFTAFVPVDLNITTNSAIIVSNINKFYFDEQVIDMRRIDDYIEYEGDTMIVVPLIRAVKERVMTSKETVRIYEFAYKGTKNSMWGMTTIPLNGARHGIVLDFLLQNDLRPETTDQEISTSLINRYIRFMYKGDQDPAVVEFLPSTTDYLRCLKYSGGEGPTNISTTASENLILNPHQQRMTFWDDIIFKYYRAPTEVSSAFGLKSSVTIVVLTLVFLVGMRL